MKTKLVALSILLAISTSVPAIEVGQTLKNLVTINGQSGDEVLATYPLVEGQWTAESVALRTNNSNSQFRDLSLMQFDGGKLQLASEYTIKVSGVTSKWLDEPCKVEPTLHKNSYQTSLWKQRCLVIEPITFLQSNNEAVRAALNSLAKRGIKNDFNSLRVTYTRYGDLDKFMRVRIHFFPSIYGLENPTVGVMNTSPWSPQNIASDPAKVKFISALTTYADLMVSNLDKAYESGKAEGPIKAFVYPEPSPEPTAKAKNDETGPTSPEARLERLKKILAQGLITKEEYETQRKNILVSF